jgi:putative ABC transport system permease protein
MALVGILTAIDALKFFLNENFSMMGSNTFTIKNREMMVQIGNKRNNPKENEPITYEQAMKFREMFDFPSAVVSVHAFASHTSTLKFGTEKTNPNVVALGTDEKYISTAGLELDLGRNFTPHETFYGSHVAIIGSEVKKDLFKKNEDPVGKIIAIGAGKYQIIGVLKEKGSSFGFSGDRRVLLPLTNARQYFSTPNQTFTIDVMVSDPRFMDEAIGESTGLFRVIRGDKVGQDNTFEVSKSDNIAKMLIENIKSVTIAATVIGLITLLGAAIGLMNIMLVSVTERTREIGIRKAMGANNRLIRNQFLVEAIVIAQFGGLIGITLGVIIGNVLSGILGSSFIMPWQWIILGVTLCLVVALLSGILPALKAARLDPIESLRYE